MSEVDTTTQAPARDVVAVAPTRAPIVAGATVAAIVPTTFEDAWRLAGAFHTAGMAPKGLNSQEACMGVILAGMEIGFTPYVSLQSFANINGRTSLWGDAIPALLWSHGFKLRERFENEDPAYPDNMKAVCEIIRPDGETIIGEFSVADGKEAGLFGIKDGPWKTAKKRMLKMRARAFCARDGASDVLKGFPIYEEAMDYEDIDAAPKPGRRVKSDLVGKLTNGAQSDSGKAPEGFDATRVATELQDGKPAIEGEPGADAVTEPRPTETASAPAADAAPASSASATDASTTSQVETSSQPDTSSPTADGSEVHDAEVEDISEGVAAPGDTYHFAGDEWGADGKRQTYKDGKALSRATRAKDLPTYAEHAPPPVVAEEPKAEAPAPTPPVDTEAQEPEPEAEGGFIASLAGMDSWLSVKQAWSDMCKTDDWLEADPADQDEVRRNVWRVVLSIKERFGDPVDHADDVTAFGIWAATQEGRDGADAIEGTFNVMRKSEVFGRLKPETQTKFELNTMNRVKALREA